FMSGDTSQFFELPGGPVGFAVGAEYRKEKVFYDQDDFTQTGLSFYNGIGTFDPTSFEVKEAFGELRLPIIRESFIHELTVNAAGRISDYKGATGTTYAYNAGVDFAPVRDLRLRANYSRAVRAPNLTDLFFPLSQNFAPAPQDPCALDFRNTPQRQANCAAAGVPANFNYQYKSSLAFQSGGNPNLQEEKSDSYTVGGVFQPRFLPGFSLTVDFYDITVNDVITSPTAQQIINACYDAASIDNQFCELFQRQGAGTGPAGEITGRILENSLQVVPLNYAKLKVRGVDAEVAYRKKFAGLGSLSTKLTYTRVLKNDAFLNPLTPDLPNRALFELGDPRDAFNFDVDLKSGPITFGYDLRYIGKQVLNQYEDFFSVGDQPPQNADYADRRFYPAVFYHDVRLSIEAGKNFDFYMGIDNVLDRDPPLGLTGAGGGSAIFTNRGRFFYAGAVARF
ncbi:MAG TPA: TonB-dependent receptor, partial [Allosphingosinicella sp.]